MSIARTVGMLVCAGVVWSPLAHASPQDLFAFGPRSVAMGQTGISHADDFGAVHANPAGLSRARGTSFTFGFAAGIYDLRQGVSKDSMQSSGADIARATLIGLTLPLPFGGVLKDRVALGLGFYTPTNVVVRGRILSPTTPQWIVLTERSQSVALQLGLGLDLGYGIRVGAGFAALAAIVGDVLITTDPTGRVGSRVDNQLVASFAPTIGVSWERSWFRVGAVFRGTLIGRFGVTIEARNIGLPLPVFNIAGIAQYDPWQLGLELGAVKQGWTVAVGAVFKRWSEYPGPVERTTSNSPAPPAVNFHDTLNVRLGVEKTFDFDGILIALRGGFLFEQSPVPDARSEAIYLDGERVAGTLGAGIAGNWLGTRVAFDLFAQMHGVLSRSVDTVETKPDGSMQRFTFQSGGAMYYLGLTGTVTF